MRVNAGRWSAVIGLPDGRKQLLGSRFAAPVAAAHAYDAAARARGMTLVNFPSGAHETQARFASRHGVPNTAAAAAAAAGSRPRHLGSSAACDARRGAPSPCVAPPPPAAHATAHEAAAAAAGSGGANSDGGRIICDDGAPPPPRRRYKGVSIIQKAKGPPRWFASFFCKHDTPRTTHLGAYDSPQAAARAFDDVARAHGVTCVNFPRPGTDETQAHFGEPAPMMARAAVRRGAEAVSDDAVDHHLTLSSCDGVPAPSRDEQSLPYYGVYPCSSGRFAAKALNAYMGRHATAAAAARAVDAHLRQLGGDALRKLNFPHLPPDDAPAEDGGAAAAQKQSPQSRKRTRADADADADAYADEHEDAVPPLFSLPAPHAAPSDGAGALAVVAPQHALTPAAANDNSGDALGAVASFLRAIAPPLSQLDAVLAALPGSGVSMLHLARLAGAAVSQGDRAMLLGTAADALHITNPFDRLAFVAALLELAPRGEGAACGGRPTRWLV